MTSKSKAKGTFFERELVKEAEARGIQAVRAWGSDGRSMGEARDVDLLVGGRRVQAKRVANLAKKYAVPESCDVTVFREDRGQTWVMMRWTDWLDGASFPEGGSGE